MKHFLRLFSYIKPYRWQYGCVLILGILASALQPGAALAVKPFLENILMHQDPHMIRWMSGGVIVFTIVCALARYGESVWTAYLTECVIQKIRREIYEKYLALSLDYYSQSSTGKMMTVIQSDVVLLMEAFNRMTFLFKDPFTILGLLGVSFYRNWKLTLMCLVVIPPLIYLVGAVGRKLKKITIGRQEQWVTVNALIHETLSGIRIIKAFNLASYLQKNFDTENKKLLTVQYKWAKVEQLPGPIFSMLGGFGLAALTYYGAPQLGVQGLSGGDIVSVGVALGLLIEPIKKINALNVGFQKALGGAERVFSFLDLEPSMRAASEVLGLKPFQKDIAFQNISFRYHADLPWVLRHINLKVNKGEVIALVGSSGAGKTTLVNLMARFYEVTEGDILIDGVSIQAVNELSLRNQISIVSQDVFLFNETIATNISYGDQTKDRSAMIEAAKAACAHEFISQLSNGYDTVIGERGVKLSGGQRQRISIARALLKDAPILILDEATSALDTESEQWVQKAIDRLMQGRTSFVIAHRLSTIRNATRIVVLQNGGLIEHGTHEELLKQKGEYAKFYQLQYAIQGTADISEHAC
ncbi:MAG: ATP-binding cassette domain-containing protein [Deltaproteobacteria bacterium]|nr:ATP-binding cassette domain-containing protein [Deltaproteobacteria bacterium]